MSYSFNVRAASLAAAITACSVKMDEVVASQPVHENDKNQALAIAEALISLIEEPADGQEISVSVSGSRQWRSEGEFIGVSLSVSACHVAKTG